MACADMRVRNVKDDVGLTHALLRMLACRPPPRRPPRTSSRPAARRSTMPWWGVACSASGRTPRWLAAPTGSWSWEGTGRCWRPRRRCGGGEGGGGRRRDTCWLAVCAVAIAPMHDIGLPGVSLISHDWGKAPNIALGRARACTCACACACALLAHSSRGAGAYGACFSGTCR